MKRLLPVFAIIAAAVSGVPAAATTLQYLISGNGFSAIFRLDSSSGASPYFTDDFFVFDVPGTYSDGSSLAGLTFYGDADAGGLTVYTAGGTEASFTGSTLFDGTIAQSTFVAFGPTVFRDYYDPSITYTASAAAVPEPASWALMITGFGLVGAATRRRVAKLA